MRSLDSVLLEPIVVGSGLQVVPTDLTADNRDAIIQVQRDGQPQTTLTLSPDEFLLFVAKCLSSGACFHLARGQFLPIPKAEADSASLAKYLKNLERAHEGASLDDEQRTRLIKGNFRYGNTKVVLGAEGVLVFRNVQDRQPLQLTFTMLFHLLAGLLSDTYSNKNSSVAWAYLPWMQSLPDSHFNANGVLGSGIDRDFPPGKHFPEVPGGYLDSSQPVLILRAPKQPAGQPAPSRQGPARPPAAPPASSRTPSPVTTAPLAAGVTIPATSSRGTTVTVSATPAPQDPSAMALAALGPVVEQLVAARLNTELERLSARSRDLDEREQELHRRAQAIAAAAADVQTALTRLKSLVADATG